MRSGIVSLIRKGITSLPDAQSDRMESGIASLIPGFDLGHALQGRYTKRGWLFT